MAQIRVTNCVQGIVKERRHCTEYITCMKVYPFSIFMSSVAYQNLRLFRELDTNRMPRPTRSLRIELTWVNLLIVSALWGDLNAGQIWIFGRNLGDHNWKISLKHGMRIYVTNLVTIRSRKSTVHLAISRAIHPCLGIPISPQDMPIFKIIEKIYQHLRSFILNSDLEVVMSWKKIVIPNRVRNMIKKYDSVNRMSLDLVTDRFKRA